MMRITVVVIFCVTQDFEAILRELMTKHFYWALINSACN